MRLGSTAAAACVVVTGIVVGACGLSATDLEVQATDSFVKITNRSKATIEVLSVSLNDGACQVFPFRWTVTTAKDDKPTPAMEWRATRPADEDGTNVFGEKFSSRWEPVGSLPLAPAGETFVEKCLEGADLASVLVKTNRGSRRYTVEK